MSMASSSFYQGTTVWNPVLESHFGWSRGKMSWAFAFARAEGGLVGPLEGILVDRLGPRRMVFVGLTILGVGLVILGSLYPTTKDVKLTFPLYIGAGYKLKAQKWFGLIGPGIRIRL